jgi:hypothetical protein
MNSLDNILGSGEAVPETKQDTTTQAVEQTAEQTTEQTAETTAADGKTPVGAIRQAEREKATKRYTEQVADFDKRLAETNAAWDRRFTQLLETVKPKAEPKPAPDWYVEPDAAFEHKFAQRAAPEFERINGAMLHNSRLIAGQLHTEDVVTAADNAFSQAVANRTIDPADYHRVLSSPNIYDAVAKWHKSVLAKQRIGDDPDAYEKRVEAEIRAKLEAEAQGTTETVTNGAAQTRPAVMPSNLATARNVGARTGPAWAGPTPLSDIFNRNKKTA